MIDIARRDPVWMRWSLAILEDALSRGDVYVNAIVFAELSISYPSPSKVEEFIGKVGATYVDLPREALFVAARAHQAYRRRGGPRTGVLPDFFIGAHAAVMDWPLLTRDPARYRAYFPTVELIAP
ncbi:MAG: type II toxin-antitoxin system VapC family toxin [Rhodospirillaceae bacterium]|nr:type II toxin-antitoxin system VapC family toxin [Rhodospirillaceae bacterium]